MSALSDFMDTSDAGKLDMFEEAHERMVTAEARVKELERVLGNLLAFVPKMFSVHPDAQPQVKAWMDVLNAMKGKTS